MTRPRPQRCGPAMAAARPARARAVLQQSVSARLQVRPPERGSEAQWVEVTWAPGRPPPSASSPLPAERGRSGRAAGKRSVPCARAPVGTGWAFRHLWETPSAPFPGWAALRAVFQPRLSFPLQSPLLAPWLSAKVTGSPFGKGTSSRRPSSAHSGFSLLLFLSPCAPQSPPQAEVPSGA